MWCGFCFFIDLSLCAIPSFDLNDFSTKDTAPKAKHALVNAFLSKIIEGMEIEFDMLDIRHFLSV